MKRGVLEDIEEVKSNASGSTTSVSSKNEDPVDIERIKTA